jgi:tRNA(Ile)-lysidine synthase
MSNFVAEVKETVKKYDLLQQRDHILVSISGGPDSVALLLGLIDLRTAFSLELVAAHVNHQLRDTESDEDEQFVRRLCVQMNVPLEVRRVDTKSLASQNSENLENCARRLRYSFLFDLAKAHRSKVATGHTLNDQAETFLMKLVRGAGPGGLSGIHPSRVHLLKTSNLESFEVEIIRPLLERTSEEVLSFLKKRNQSCRQDSSNRDLSLDRNWVRHQLVPMLEDKLNPSLLQTLRREISLFREIEEFLVLQSQESLGRLQVKGEDETKVSISELIKFPAILQKEMVRQILLELQGNLSNITLRHVTDVLRLLESPSGKEVHLPQAVKVQREFDELRFSSEVPPKNFSYKLKIPGEVYVKEVDKNVQIIRSSGKQTAGDILLRLPSSSLRIRNRRPGDCYSISNTSSNRKLKQLFQEERVPRSQRAKRIILELDQKIIWVEGFPVHPRHQWCASQAEEFTVRVSSGTLF